MSEIINPPKKFQPVIISGGGRNFDYPSSSEVSFHLEKRIFDTAVNLNAMVGALSKYYPDLTHMPEGNILDDAIAVQLKDTIQLITKLSDYAGLGAQRNYLEDVVATSGETVKGIPTDGELVKYEALLMYNGMVMLDEFITAVRDHDSPANQSLEKKYPTPLLMTSSGCDQVENCVSETELLLGLNARRNNLAASKITPPATVDSSRRQLHRYMGFVLDAGNVPHRSKRNRAWLSREAAAVALSYFAVENPDSSPPQSS